AKAADILGAEDVVVHPGSIEDRHCSTKNAVRFMRRLDDRFIIENLPGKGADGKRLGGSYWQMRSLLRKTGKGMCLDFAHAAEYAHQNKMDYIRFIKRMISLNPFYFHVSDTRLQTGKDLHLHLKEGNLRLFYLQKLVPAGARIAIETNHEFRKQHRDIMLLRENAAED
ncbi:TIM barrel protein, partial [Candidatus Woesearchaeota archaeon]|nr:TIM barrel protein [Candidatus Woesearchaeota archaeon]